MKLHYGIRIRRMKVV